MRNNGAFEKIRAVNQLPLKKSKELKKFVSEFYTEREAIYSKVLLIEGAAGAGKTTIVKDEILNNFNGIKVYISFEPDENVFKYSFLETILFKLLHSFPNTYAVAKDQIFANSQDLKIASVLFELLILVKKGMSIEKFVYEVGKKQARTQDKNFKYNLISKLNGWLSERQKVLYVIEDIHFSVIDSVNEFLSFHAKNEKEHVLVICTTRPSKTKKIRTNINHKKIPLDKLSVRDIHTLIDKNYSFVASDNEIKYIHKISGGNLYNVSQALELGNLTIGKHEGAKDLILKEKENISDQDFFFTTRRLNLLDKTEFKVLETAAIIGNTFDLNLLKKLIPFSNIEEKLDVLLSKGFLEKVSENIYSFHHHLTHQVISENIDQKTLIRHCELLLNYYKKLFHQNPLLSVRVAEYANKIEKTNYAYLYYYKYARILFQQYSYSSAIDIFLKAKEQLKKIKDGQKKILRLTKINLFLIDCYSITGELNEIRLLGEDIKACISHIRNKKVRSDVYAKMTLPAFAAGDLQEALLLSHKALEISKNIRSCGRVIRDCVRLGVISSDLGQNTKAFDYAQAALESIKSSNNDENIGLLAGKKASIYGTLVRTLTQLNRRSAAKSFYEKSIKILEEDISDFGKFYLSIHCSHYPFFYNEFTKADIFINRGEKYFKESNGRNIAPDFFALRAYYLSLNGNYESSEENLNHSLKIREENGGTVNAFVSLLYAENLLLQFRSKEFTKVIDEEIARTICSNRLYVLGWLYLYKAIYYSFYEESFSNFMPAYTEAKKISNKVSMPLLEENLRVLIQENPTAQRICNLGVYHKEDLPLNFGSKTILHKSRAKNIS